MIEDQELRNLFRTESEEHLQQIEKGLLKLERHPRDFEVLEEVFRQAHNLKGEARMLGLADIENLSHRFESLLGGARKSDTVLTLEVFGNLYHTLDDIRRLVKQAVTEEPSQMGISEEDAALEARQECSVRQKSGKDMNGQTSLKTHLSPGTETAQRNLPKITNLQEPKPDGMPLAGIQAGSSAEGNFRITTIRVATKKLDSLMVHSGELKVINNRINYGLKCLEEISEVQEKLNHNSIHLRSLLKEMETGEDQGVLKKLLNCHQQEAKLLDGMDIQLKNLKNYFYEDLTKLDYVSSELASSIYLMRLLPLSTVLNLFPRMVRDLCLSQGKEVKLSITGQDSTVDKNIIEHIKDPLMHLVRNALDHGIESPEDRERSGKTREGSLRIKASQTSSSIVLEVSDDGRGLDLEAIKQKAVKSKLCHTDAVEAMSVEELQGLIFHSGFSTSSFISDVSGRGVGLDVVRANVEALKGTIDIDSVTGKGCTFRVELPLSLSHVRVLVVVVNGRKYAIHEEAVEAIRLVNHRNFYTIEGKEAFLLANQPLSVVILADLLELKSFCLPESSHRSGSRMNKSIIPCVILACGRDRLGLLVDEIVDEQEVVLKPQSRLLQRVRNVSGATILGTGEICIILNHQDLIKSARRHKAIRPSPGQASEVLEKKHILIAEDSLITRIQLKRILEGEGYEVVTAVDGLDAFNKLDSRGFDALVSDIMMPNMTGLELTEKVRQNRNYQELPVILVTSLASDADRQRGLEVGANAYITKPAFDQKLLLDTLKRFI